MLTETNGVCFLMLKLQAVVSNLILVLATELWSSAKMVSTSNRGACFPFPVFLYLIMCKRVSLCELVHIECCVCGVQMRALEHPELQLQL